jgi:hypothetical protein
MYAPPTQNTRLDLPQAFPSMMGGYPPASSLPPGGYGAPVNPMSNFPGHSAMGPGETTQQNPASTAGQGTADALERAYVAGFQKMNCWFEHLIDFACFFNSQVFVIRA